MSHVLRYGINHMVAPQRSIAGLIDLAAALELDGVELRNDVPGGSPCDDPGRVRDLASAAGVSILSINALQRFNHWTPAREAEARELARTAHACGAEMLALCPVNDDGFFPSETERLGGPRDALRRLAPILADARIMGLIEHPSFKICTVTASTRPRVLRCGGSTPTITPSIAIEGGDVAMVPQGYHHCGTAQSLPR